MSVLSLECACAWSAPSRCRESLSALASADVDHTSELQTFPVLSALASVERTALTWWTDRQRARSAKGLSVHAQQSARERSCYWLAVVESKPRTMPRPPAMPPSQPPATTPRASRAWETSYKVRQGPCLREPARATAAAVLAAASAHARGCCSFVPAVTSGAGFVPPRSPQTSRVGRDL